MLQVYAPPLPPGALRFAQIVSGTFLTTTYGAPGTSGGSVTMLRPVTVKGIAAVAVRLRQRRPCPH